MPLGIRLGSSTTAAATTGPASGPRPASSQPATGQMPRLIIARSRRKLGGATAITPFGSLAGSFSDLSRIMPTIVLKHDPRRNRELETMPDIQISRTVPFLRTQEPITIGVCSERSRQEPDSKREDT